jgi:integrase/recombinase XerC
MNLFGISTPKRQSIVTDSKNVQILPIQDSIDPLAGSIAERSIGLVARALVADDNIWAEFLKLQISEHTKRTYASALNDFFLQMTGVKANPHQIREFLNLPSSQAIAVVLSYRSRLLALNLSPNTINTRLAAIKSLVNHARKLSQCGFSLEDVASLKVEIYRDTSGVDATVYRGMIEAIDRETVGGKRDYAIMRLLWDNALRRGEVTAVNIEDFHRDKLWIMRKGKIQKQSVDLAFKTQVALNEWLGVRGGEAKEPLFIALDNRSYGHRLSGRALGYLVERLAKDADVSKRMSPHRVRHSAITTALNISDGNVRDARLLSGHAKLETLVIYDDRRKNVQGKVSSKLADLV